MKLPWGPHSQSPRELKRQIEAEREGHPFLLYRDGSGQQQVFSLADPGPRLAIGRGAASDVWLYHDPEVSNLHAELERVGEDWVVVDDGLSRNGSYLDGRRVFGRRRLRDGDTLRLGGTYLVYRNPAQHEAETTQTHRAVGAERQIAVSDAQRRVLTALCRPLRDGGPYGLPPQTRRSPRRSF